MLGKIKHWDEIRHRVWAFLQKVNIMANYQTQRFLKTTVWVHDPLLQANIVSKILRETV
jgi:hypothetical protein